MLGLVFVFGLVDSMTDTDTAAILYFDLGFMLNKTEEATRNHIACI